MSTATHAIQGKTLALLLASVLTMSPVLIFAADIPSRIAIGSVQGVGNVELRGMSVAREGTLFLGDTISTRTNSLSHLILANGSKVELFENTQCTVKDGNQHITVRLMAGNVGFAASSKPVAIAVSDFEILPEPTTTGGVAFLNKDFAGIRIMSGSAIVRNVKTGKSRKLSGGSFLVVNLKTAELDMPIAQLASTASPSLPSSSAPMPQIRPAGGGSTPWLLIGAGVGAAVVLVTYFATRHDHASPSTP